AGIVDDCVPFAALQGVDLAVAVAVELLDRREHPRVGLPAVEERQRVAARLGGLDERRAEEAGASEDEDLQFPGGGGAGDAGAGREGRRGGGGLEEGSATDHGGAAC